MLSSYPDDFLPEYGGDLPSAPRERLWELSGLEHALIILVWQGITVLAVHTVACLGLVPSLWQASWYPWLLPHVVVGLVSWLALLPLRVERKHRGGS